MSLSRRRGSRWTPGATSTAGRDSLSRAHRPAAVHGRRRGRRHGQAHQDGSAADVRSLRGGRGPPEVEALVFRLLAKEPAMRPKTAEALAAELAHLVRRGSRARAACALGPRGGPPAMAGRARRARPVRRDARARGRRASPRPVALIAVAVRARRRRAGRGPSLERLPPATPVAGTPPGQAGAPGGAGAPRAADDIPAPGSRPDGGANPDPLGRPASARYLDPAHRRPHPAGTPSPSAPPGSGQGTRRTGRSALDLAGLGPLPRFPRLVHRIRVSQVAALLAKTKAGTFPADGIWRNRGAGRVSRREPARHRRSCARSPAR